MLVCVRLFLFDYFVIINFFVATIQSTNATQINKHIGVDIDRLFYVLNHLKYERNTMDEYI